MNSAIKLEKRNLPKVKQSYENAALKLWNELPVSI